MGFLQHRHLADIVVIPADQQLLELFDHLDEGDHVNFLEHLVHEGSGFFLD
jgi:hypothetical protein